MKPITLPLFYHTEDTSQLSEAGLDYPIADCNVRNSRFYRIDAVLPHKEADGQTFAKVVSGGVQYIVNLSMKEAVAMIDEAHK
jgi:hypothetical protein